MVDLFTEINKMSDLLPTLFAVGGLGWLFYRVTIGVSDGRLIFILLPKKEKQKLWYYQKKPQINIYESNMN